MRKSILSVVVALTIASPVFAVSANAAESTAAAVKSDQVEKTVFALLAAQRKLDADRGAHVDSGTIAADEAAVDQLNKTMSGLTGMSFTPVSVAKTKTAEAIAQRMADDQRKLDMDQGMHAPNSVIAEDKGRLSKDQSELRGLSGSN